MTTRSYEIFTDVEFEYDPETVDPFWFDDDGVRTWRMTHIYDIPDEDGIWKHLAYNAISNGVTDASRLDGWADLEPGQLTMFVVHNTLTIEEA